MALLPTGWIKMPGDNDETKRFAWSHVKSIFYNKAANILLKDKLDEMDKIIDEKIAKALMSNVQVNDQGKIPTSALAYAMQQSITKNGQDIAKLNSDLGYYITSEDDFSHTLIGGAAQNITLNSKITLEQYTRILFLNYPGSNDGALLAIAPGDKIITAFRNNGVWEEKSSHFIATKSDLTPSFYPIPKPASINGLDNITIWEVRAFKSGKIVCLTINIDGVLSANTDWKILFTLPNEYRPSEGSVILNYITQHGKAMVMDINTGGDVRIVCPSGEGILKGDWVCRQCITYVTES